MKTTRKEHVSTGRVGLFYSCFCCKMLLTVAYTSYCPLVGGIQQVCADVQEMLLLVVKLARGSAALICQGEPCKANGT